ncbi:hypothetical protein [Flavobacterium psychrotrophum]|uniref:hypothetical protein n=1 Tax=Flavobacterium psychrotrophum TaxID=2294119 RepID=UPI000E323989|nr:hypothetical protein [Flavobacterium psychrotrophum]
MDIKQKVNMFLKQNGSSQPDFAERIGVNYVAMNRNINAGKLTTEIVYGLLKEFPHVDLNWLFKDENQLLLVKEEEEEYGATPQALLNKLRKTLDELENKISE